MEAELVPTNVGDAVRDGLPGAYGDFWRAVQRHLGGKVAPDTLNVDPKQAIKNETVRLSFGSAESPIVFSAITNSRGAPLTNAFDIYLYGTQFVGRIKQDDGTGRWVILRSEFQILYLNALDRSSIARHWREKTTASLAYCGYKFISNAAFPFALNYPDCHVSYCLEGIREEVIERRFLEGHDGWKVRAKHGQPQIPSAPMDLAAIIYMILHCHNPSTVEAGWPKNMRPLVVKLPNFALDINARSVSVNWYEHSHSVPQEGAVQVLTRAPLSFRLPKAAAAASWGARIWGHETTEVPHITINRGQDQKWRLSLRDGNPLEGTRDEIQQDLLAEIDRTKADWQALWDAHYKGNLVGEHTW